MGLDNPIHIAFLLILLLLVFGAKRLPEMGRSLGAGMRGFKDSISGEHFDAAPRQPAARRGCDRRQPGGRVRRCSYRAGRVAAPVARAEPVGAPVAACRSAGQRDA